MIKFTFKGAKVLSNKFQRASDRVDSNMGTLITKEVDNLLKRTIRDAPKGDTKRLYRSFDKRKISDSPNIVYEVFSDLDYAPFQEFGTRDKNGSFVLSSVHVEFASFAEKFKRYGQPIWSNKARKYFLPNYILARRAVARQTKTIINNLMK